MKGNGIPLMLLMVFEGKLTDKTPNEIVFGPARDRAPIGCKSKPTMMIKANNEIVFSGTLKECQKHLDVAARCNYLRKNNMWESFSHRYIRLYGGYEYLQ